MKFDKQIMLWRVYNLKLEEKLGNKQKPNLGAEKSIKELIRCFLTLL